MKESVFIKFLYKTVVGRALLRMLVSPKVSDFAGKYLKSGASKWLVPYYIRKYGIDMSDIEIPKGGFSSFNEFFIRKRKKSGNISGKDLISPCDGFLTFAKIRKSTVFNIKNTQFSLENLLKSRKLAEKFYDGAALIFRLTPANYHRYCYAASGKIIYSKRVSGVLHCVRPVAQTEFPVFVQNSREYQVIKTEKFGTVVQMEIGALLVGKINNYIQNLYLCHVNAGDEKGYFEFGGSTIMILLQKDAASRLFNDERLLKPSPQKRHDADEEIPVRMGDVVSNIRLRD